LTALRFGGLDITAVLRTPALAALRPLLTPNLPALTDVRFDGRVVVPADAGSVAFKNAKLLTREGDVTGDWTLGRHAELTMDGRLVSPRLDMDLMLAAFGVELPAAPAVGDRTGPVISTAPLPWVLLRGPEVKLSTRIEAMTFQGQVWNKVDFVLDLNAGRLLISPLTLSLPDGQLRMSMEVDASRDTVPVSLELHAPGIPLGLVARYAGLPGPMNGTVRVDARLRATGQSPHELAASLDGTVAAVLVGGSMTNAAFIMLTSASLEALGISVPTEGETALHCLGVVGTFTNGVGLLRVALGTTYLQMDGSGRVDFARETVAFKLHPLAQISGSAIAVPVVVEGPFRAVKGRLDADGIDKLGLFIDSLFGSDRSTVCIDAGFVPRSAPGGKPG
jgi:AsmA protein